MHFLEVEMNVCHFNCRGKKNIVSLLKVSHHCYYNFLYDLLLAINADVHV